MGEKNNALTFGNIVWVLSCVVTEKNRQIYWITYVPYFNQITYAENMSGMQGLINITQDGPLLRCMDHPIYIWMSENEIETIRLFRLLLLVLHSSNKIKTISPFSFSHIHILCLQSNPNFWEIPQLGLNTHKFTTNDWTKYTFFALCENQWV